MNTETEKTKQWRPELGFYHANAKGTGCVTKFELHPAHDTVNGSIFTTFAAQKTPCDVRRGIFATYDWANQIVVRLDFMDLALLLQVFRGVTEKINDGAGIFHRNGTANTIIKLEHRVEPAVGYSFEVSRKKPDDAQPRRLGIFFSPGEALGLSLAIEQSMGLIAFGVPRIFERADAVPPAAANEVHGA